MLEIFKENYYVDFDAVEKYVDISDTPTIDVSGNTEVKINIVRYEMVKLMMDVIMTEQDIQDEKLGIQNSNLSIPFKLAFNSLLNKKLINKY
jgi:hypothetical protein